ncbi:MAG TPA: SGNH/GDSL hydrolase family protein [Pseudomonadales bacterium]
MLFIVLCAAAGISLGAPPFCGDTKCSGKETVIDCPEDCSAASVCGDGDCNGGETCSSCESDCGVCPAPICNNDGVCNAGEDCLGCPDDCNGVTGGKPSGRYCCGQGSELERCLGPGKDTDTMWCGVECGDPIVGAVCGNGVVENNEECDDGNTNIGDGCDDLCLLEPPVVQVPANQFNIGDSIGEGEAAEGTIGSANHQTVWSTGFDGADSVTSLNERFDANLPDDYHENNAARDGLFNHAVSGAVMADFASQASAAVSAAAQTPTGLAGQITVLLGNNDVCAEVANNSAMTDPTTFEYQYRAGLDVLAASPRTGNARIFVSSLPAIYWLWDAKRSDFYCQVIAWPFVPCQNLLAGASDDCDSPQSRNDPDNVYPRDGTNCKRRKEFHALIRDTYNPILEGVLAEYRSNGTLPNTEYVDVFDVRFNSTHVNGGDCFHPSEAGHALLGDRQYCRSSWSEGDSSCSP